MNELVDELIVEILDYFETNKYLINVRRTCKKLKNICDSYGYIREVVLSSYNIMYPWLVDKKGVKRVTLEGITKPQDWIAHIPWKKYMIFNYCLFGSSLISPCDSPETEEIIIDGILGGPGNYVLLNLNWSSFINLQKLHIKIQDVNIDGLEICKKLKSVYIETTKSIEKTFPKNLCSLPNLEYLICNFIITEHLHFISPYLKVLLVEKTKKCTSASNLVPYRHLNDIRVGFYPF